MTSDFEVAISTAQSQDLIFADPPYTISRKQKSFIKYNESLFTWKNQERLCNALVTARTRGAYIIATNAKYELLEQMYKDHGFFVKVVERNSVISGNAKLRCKQEELLISSMPFVDK